MSETNDEYDVRQAQRAIAQLVEEYPDVGYHCRTYPALGTPTLEQALACIVELCATWGTEHPDIRAEREESRSDIRNAVEDIYRLEGELREAHDRLETTETDLRGADERIDDLQEELASARALLAEREASTSTLEPWEFDAHERQAIQVEPRSVYWWLRHGAAPSDDYSEPRMLRCTDTEEMKHDLQG